MGAPTEKDASLEGGEQVVKRELRTFTWEEVQKLNTKENAHCIIDGNVYAVAAFSKIHPGGSIINRYAGQDATDAFYAFHGEEPGSPGLLALPRYLAGRLVDSPPVPAHLEDFRALRKQIASEGLMKASPRWFAGMFGFYAALYITSLITLWVLPPGIWSTLLSCTFALEAISHSSTSFQSLDVTLIYVSKRATCSRTLI